MYIIATFNHSLQLEIAITQLEEHGMAKDSILAVPLQRQRYAFHVFDSIHSSDGVSLLGGALAFGTFSMVLGTIYGFLWYWGPIVWGLIFLFCGTSIWLTGAIVYMKNRQAKTIAKEMRSGSNCGDVVLLIRCDRPQFAFVKEILTSSMAQAIGVIEL